MLYTYFEDYSPTNFQCVTEEEDVKDVVLHDPTTLIRFKFPSL